MCKKVQCLLASILFMNLLAMEEVESYLPLSVKNIVKWGNAHQGDIQGLLENPAVQVEVETLFTDSRIFAEIDGKKGKFTGKLKEAYRSYWQRKISEALSSGGEEALKKIYGQQSLLMQRYLAAVLLSSETFLSVEFKVELEQNISDAFSNTESLSVLYSFVPEKMKSIILGSDTIRLNLEKALQDGTLEEHLLANQTLEYSLQELVKEYYNQEISKIMDSEKTYEEQMEAFNSLYAKTKSKLAQSALTEILIKSYCESLKNFIGTGKEEKSPIRDFCEQNLDRNMLGKRAVKYIKDFLKVSRSLSADPEWRTRYFNYVIATDFGTESNEILAEAMIEFAQRYSGPNLFGRGRNDVKDIYKLYYEKTGVAQKIFSNPKMFPRIGRLIENGSLDDFLTQYKWMQFENVIEAYYIDKYKTKNAQEFKELLESFSADSPRRVILEKIALKKYPNYFKRVNGKFESNITELEEEELLKRLYIDPSKKGTTLSEDELIKLFEDVLQSRIFTGKLKISFRRVRPEAVVLIHALQTIQQDGNFYESGIVGLIKELKEKKIFEKYPKLWFVLASRSMEGQQSAENVRRMKAVFLESLQDFKEGASFEKRFKERGFVASCRSWLRAWKFKRQYKGLEAAQVFLKGVQVARGLSTTSGLLQKYRDPASVCTEVGVILSKMSEVDSGQMSSILKKLANIPGIDQGMIQDEIVRRLSTQEMQDVFMQEMENLEQLNMNETFTIDTINKYGDAVEQLGEAQREAVKRGGAQGDSTEKGDATTRLATTITTTTTVEAAQQKRLREQREEVQRKLQERRELLDRMRKGPRTFPVERQGVEEK